MLALLRNEAQHRGLATTVLTFEPHPRDYFAQLVGKPETAPSRIATLRDKLQELERCGVDQVVILPFDRALASLSPDNFIDQVLVNGLRASTCWWVMTSALVPKERVTTPCLTPLATTAALMSPA